VIEITTKENIKQLEGSDRRRRKMPNKEFIFYFGGLHPVAFVTKTLL
jgi:hypothetical protein